MSSSSSNNNSNKKEAHYRKIDPKGLLVFVADSNETYSLDGCRHSYFTYEKNKLSINDENDVVNIEKQRHVYHFKTVEKVPRVGVMLVGLAGNNGSTLTLSILANRDKVKWETKDGLHTANYYGSMTQSSTIRIGCDDEGREVHIPFNKILPMVDPNTLVIGGWDIRSCNIEQAAADAGVLPLRVQQLVAEDTKKMKPLPSVYYPDFIASNQEDRANNILSYKTKAEDLDHIQRDIRNFKKENNLDKVIVVWTANTERFVEVRKGLNMTADDICNAIHRSDPEISPSQIFAVASIMEGCPYINGSPQNTLVPGIVELAENKGVFVGGDDFKSGQTKLKSVLVDFLVSAGIKPESIVSYNHLGNNDGKNLSEPKQFRSKEISKSNVVDDMVAMNPILYPDGKGPDHTVVIKYVPFVGDSKRAMDEYTSSIFMNGLNTLVIHNTCEDSLLAAPLIIDLVVMTELMTRISYRTTDDKTFRPFYPVLSILSYWLKAPMVKQGTPVVNALTKQQRCITNILCACAGIALDNDMLLEHKTNLPSAM